MAKVFFRTFLDIFLWIILIVNLIYFTNYVGNMSYFAAVWNPVDYSDKYFGISSFIDAFKSLEYDFQFVNDVSNFKDGVFKAANDLLYNDSWDAIMGDGANTGNEFLDFFQDVGNGIAAVFMSISSIFVFIFGIGCFMFYLTTMIFGLAGIMLKFANGSFYKELPRTYDAIMLMKNLIMI